MAKIEYPKCGLYRTSRAHPERTTAVPAGRLVYFHNHSDSGEPVVLLPQKNTSNKWAFQTKGYLVKDTTWPASLVALKGEGFYRLGEPLRTGANGLIPAGELVQLGYNGDGAAIGFFAAYDAERNALTFSPKGAKLGERTYDRLEAVSIGGPGAKKAPEPS